MPWVLQLTDEICSSLQLQVQFQASRDPLFRVSDLILAACNNGPAFNLLLSDLLSDLLLIISPGN